MALKNLLVLCFLVVLGVVSLNGVSAQNRPPQSMRPSTRFMGCYTFNEADGNTTTDECLWGAGAGVDFLESLGFFPPALGLRYNVPEPQTCRTYENYCIDELSKKRQNVDRVQSILFDVGPFSTDATMESLVENFQDEVNDGVFSDDIVTVYMAPVVDCELLDQNDNLFCPNQCGDCGVQGTWHMEESNPCSDFSGCSSSIQTSVRTVVQYSGDDVLGETDSALTITQYWDFGDSALGDNDEGSCTATWDATFRFYSDASQCRLNSFDISESSCDVDCDSTVSSSLRGVVCNRDNVLILNDIDAIIFQDDCQNYEYQDQTWHEGAGADEENEPIEPLPPRSSAGVLTAGVVGIVAGVMGALF